MEQQSSFSDVSPILPQPSGPQLAVFINLFVVAVFAHGFYDRDDAPQEIGLENAGQYLGQVWGTGFRGGYSWRLSVSGGKSYLG